MKAVLLIALILGISTYSFAQDMGGMKMDKPQSPPVKKKTSTETEKVFYTCVMHLQIKKDKPGNCPICGMKLVKKTIKATASKATSKGDMPMRVDTMPQNDMKGTYMKKDTEVHKSMKMDTSVNKMKMDDKGGMNFNTEKADTMPVGMNMKGGDMNMMSDPYSLNLPMERHGSGTGWLPDASPMNAYMYHSAKWMFMLHGNLFLRYTHQDLFNTGTRGGEQFDAPDWVMFMGQRPVGKKGLFHFSTMFSLDPVGVSNAGYPLLFQSGEAYKGKPIVDRQHPHDLFSELSVSYSYAFSKKTDAFVYIGYPGEPALGPVAFMHRPAALYNPDAPLSHHWSDATHITFGVATVGVRIGDIKIDASSFKGREPDDNRYDFDKPLFDSYSGRLAYNPSKNWALQASYGFIKSPEALHPDEDVNRTTASAIYSLPFSKEGWLNASAVFGANKIKGHSAENSFLLEASVTKKKATLYSRYEYVQKSIEELSLDENTYGTGAVFPVNAFTLGVNYDLFHIGNTNLSAGTQFTYYHADERLDALYGKNPMAGEVYLRIYPRRTK